jgi:hypothetical protein
MKLLVDECTGPAVALWLEQQGHDYSRFMVRRMELTMIKC